MMENGSSAVIRSSEDTIKKFQTYLRRYENDNKLVILEGLEKPGTKPGDNYLSVLIRTKLIGKRGDGSAYTKTFMMKKIAEDKKISTLVDFSIMFSIETHVYSKILPVLGSFGPPYVYTDKGSIIMEDLAEKGYANCERRNYLDLNHTIITLKKLAKFHASALAVKINNPRQFEALCMPLKEIIYKDSETSDMKMWTEAGIKSILQYLDMVRSQTQELQTIRDHIVTCTNEVYDILYRLFNAQKQKYDTFCHGDPWINNLLFLHDKDGRILDLKMVDYQIVRHISLATDILYFVYSSVRSSLIEKSFESLIKIYHNEFLSELRQLHVDEKILKDLGMEWLNKELHTWAYHGLLTGCFFINPIFAEEEDVKRFEKMDTDMMDPQGDMNSAINRKKTDRIKCIAFHYYRRLHLGIINDDIEPISITG